MGAAGHAWLFCLCRCLCLRLEGQNGLSILSRSLQSAQQHVQPGQKRSEVAQGLATLPCCTCWSFMVCLL